MMKQRRRDALLWSLFALLAILSSPALAAGQDLGTPKRIGDSEIVAAFPDRWVVEWSGKDRRALAKEVPARLRNANLTLQVLPAQSSLSVFASYHKSRTHETHYAGARLVSEKKIEQGSVEGFVYHLTELPSAYAGFDLFDAILRLEGKFVVMSMLFDRGERIRYDAIFDSVLTSIRIADDADRHEPVSVQTKAVRADGSREIVWFGSFEEAFHEAEKLGLPVMIAFHHDSQPVCRTLIEKVYRDREILELSRNFVCLPANASDYGDESSLYGGVTSGMHQQIEMQARQKYLHTDVAVAPQHIFCRPDGEMLFRHEYAPSKTQLADWMREAIRAVGRAADVNPVEGPYELYVESDNDAYRRDLVSRLIRSDREAALEHLVEKLASARKSRDLARVLEVVGDAGRPELIAHVLPLLDHRSTTIRGAAARCAEAIASPTAREALRKRLAVEKRSDVKGCVLRALAASAPRDGATADAVLDQTRRGSRQLQRDALLALRHFPESEIVIERLLDVLATARSEELQAAAAWPLAELEEQRAIETLQRLVDGKRKSGRLSRVFAGALAKLGGGGEPIDPSNAHFLLTGECGES